MAISQSWKFLKGFYTDRYRLVTRGHVQRDPTALLHLGPGQRNPYPLYERIRGQGPISRTPLPDTIGHHVTVDHASCNQILRSPTFGVSLDNSDAELSILDLNPPDHTRLRRLVARDFTPRRVQAFAPRIQSVLDGLLDELPAGRPFDLISAIAAPLPIAVITGLLGIPDPDAEEFALHGTEIGSALGGIQSVGHARRLEETQQRLGEIFTKIFALRRQEPTDDVIGRIVAADDTISPEEMVPLCTLLLIAGFETTVNLIGNTLLALLNHTEQWQLVCGQPDLAERAVQEGLRYDSPVQRTERFALNDTEVDGYPVRNRELVIVGIGGANRDPAVFNDPNRFDITRPDAGNHLSFSGGIHYCLGAPLAQLEAEIALQTIATRLPGLRLAGTRQRRPGSLIRGMSRFPVFAPERRDVVVPVRN